MAAKSEITKARACPLRQREDILSACFFFFVFARGCVCVCVCVFRDRENERKLEEREGLMGREKGESKERRSPSCRFGGGLQDNLKAVSKQGDFSPTFFGYILFKCCLEQTKLETNEPTNSQTHTQSKTTSAQKGEVPMAHLVCCHLSAH